MMSRQIRKRLCLVFVMIVITAVFMFDRMPNETVRRPRYEVTKSTYSHEQAWKTFRSSLQLYKDLHKKGVDDLQSSKPSNVRTLTWACNRKTCNCGLGDQQFKIQFFFLLALMSNRVFIATWDDDLRQRTENIKPNQINWDVFNSTLGMCSDDTDARCTHKVYRSKSFFGFGWTEHEYERFGEALFGKEQHITALANIFVSSMFVGVKLMMKAGKQIEDGFERLGVNAILDKDRYSGVHFTHGSPWYAMLHAFGLTNILRVLPMNNGHVLASESWIQLNHVIFNYLFEFPNSLMTQVTELKKSLEIDRQPYVAVHLRTGFQGSSHVDSIVTRWLFKNWKFFDESSWSCILAHSVEVSNRMIGPNSPIYLATDSLHAKEWAKKVYGSRIRSAAINPTHFAHGSNGSSLWVDFHILGGAKIFVHGDSSYATNAAFLAPIPLSRQAWIWKDDSRNCMVSQLGNNSTCIC